MNLSKKDLITINQEVGSNGKFHSEDSLDFALSIAKQNKSWLYELSYIVRSLLVDPCFEDGNKRTAIIVIMTYFENNDLDCDKDKLIKTVWDIAKKNTTDMSVNRKAISEHAQKLEVFDINKLMRLMKNAIIP